MKQARAAKSSAKTSKIRAKKAARAKPVAKAKKAKKAEKPAKASSKLKLLKEKPKAEEMGQNLKKILQNPVEPFFKAWKPKNESLEAGILKCLDDWKVPEKEKPQAYVNIMEKVQAVMRKENLSPAIEEQLAERFSKDRVHKIGSIFSMKPKTCVRLNFLKADIRGFGESLAAKELKIKKSAISPWAFEVGKPEDAIQHPVFERGLIDFQDEGSQLIALLSNARPGHRVLDMVAGDGSHALSMGSMMRNKGSLFIYDADGKKLKNFKERAQKAGIDSYRILTDSQISEVKSLDVVIVEAPSSSLGQIGHKPDLKVRFNKDELGRIHKLQAALLREGARKLKLGGYLIYATSTMNKSENEGQIEHFLRTSHNSFRLVPMSQYLQDFTIPYMENFFHFKWDAKTLASMAESDPFLFLSPDVHGCQGMFVAVIQRTRIST
jgi:16S rRNA (cytosine967-C5)-methyltransferase